MRVLLIEDDQILGEVLRDSLATLRYGVDWVTDGQMGWDYSQSLTYDLILIDVGLPKINGLELCSRLRRQGCSTPILLMTAKEDRNARVQGLDTGADDYLFKPIDIQELQARLRALLRRRQVLPTAILEVGELRLNPQNCQVTYHENLLNLTPKEYQILELFLRNPNRIFSRSQLIDQLWSFEEFPLEDSVKAHIKGLRQKLKKVNSEVGIENVYGLGYRLNPNLKNIPTTNNNKTSQFQQAQEKLWQKYQDLIRERLDILQTTAQQLATNSLSDDLRNLAAQAAHKLAGVLGMFEREQGSILAKKIEKLLSAEKLEAENLIGLIQSLIQDLNITTSQNSSDLVATGSLLLISADDSLYQALQESSKLYLWQQVTSLEMAKTWLENNHPVGVIFDLDNPQQKQISLNLISQLSGRIPTVTSLVLASDYSTLERVEFAQAGVQGFLDKPIDASQIWAVFSQLLQRNQNQSLQILVIDDDPIFLATLPPLLEPWGIRVTGLANPCQGWEILAAIKPDLLILDVEMPQLGGIELCRMIRTAAEWQDLPILFLTAHQEIEMVQEIFRAGGDDYILKPVQAKELLTRINQRFQRKKAYGNTGIAATKSDL
jgi:DNA-binding response OmpR family regulator